MPVVECQTEDCPNAVPIELGEELRPVDADGQPVADSAWLILCGVCGQPIASVSYAQEGGS